MATPSFSSPYQNPARTCHKLQAELLRARKNAVAQQFREGNAAPVNSSALAQNLAPAGYAPHPSYVEQRAFAAPLAMQPPFQMEVAAMQDDLIAGSFLVGENLSDPSQNHYMQYMGPKRTVHVPRQEYQK